MGIRTNILLLKTLKSMINDSLLLINNSDPTESKIDFILFLQDHEDWELVEEERGRMDDLSQTENPSQCECGRRWKYNSKREFSDSMPNQDDINNCFNAIQFPNQPQECDEPCVPVEEFRFQRYAIYKNKKDCRFFLVCFKVVQWHCEIVIPIPT